MKLKDCIELLRWEIAFRLFSFKLFKLGTLFLSKEEARILEVAIVKELAKYNAKGRKSNQ